MMFVCFFRRSVSVSNNTLEYLAAIVTIRWGWDKGWNRPGIELARWK
jgi:hypothetical protein